MNLMNNRFFQAFGVIACLLAIILVAFLAVPKPEETNELSIEESDIVETSTELNTNVWSAGIESCFALDENVLTEALINSNTSQNDIFLADGESEISEKDDEYQDFAIANVDNYVNVRAESNTDSEIVGRMYDGAVAQILEYETCDDGEWLKVVSGETEGYIKAEYFIYGDAAAEVIEDYVDRYAFVDADRLNIREEANIDSKRIGYANKGEKLKLDDEYVADDNGWVYVDYGTDKKGYVSADYVTIREEFIYAKTMEEIHKQEEEQALMLARATEDETVSPENLSLENTTEPVSYTATGDLRNDIVNNALQYVGYPYVHGGNSLATGTDCSGFTSLIYAQYGYSLSRTPSGQLSSNGRSISLDEAQPGDIICYGKSKCTHVAIYIGNGQIVHAANPRKGVVVYNVGYDNILGVKNVID